MSASPLDPSGLVVTDTQCRRCSYNLRGLHPGGLCPECGTPIAISIRGDALRFSDPNHLARLSIGTLLVTCAILVRIIVRYVFQSMFAVLFPPSLLYLILALVNAAGTWLLTTPDPGEPAEAQVPSRRWARLLIWATAAGHSVQLIAIALERFSIPVPAVQAVALCLVLLGSAGEFLRFTWLARLSRRIPDDSFYNGFRSLRWSYSLTLVGLNLLSWVIFLGRGMRYRSILLAILSLYGLLHLAMIITAIMAGLLLLRFRNSIADQTTLARKTWQVGL